MQAIAGVNWVFQDKHGGLVVDYLRQATQLQKAVSDYTESRGKGDPVEMQKKAVAKMLELREVCAGMMHGYAAGVVVARYSLLGRRFFKPLGR